MRNAKYEVIITPLYEGLTPYYEVMIYRSIYAGVCGPFSEKERVDADIEAVESWVVHQGYLPSGEYSEIHRNGFATSPIYTKEEIQ